MIYILAFITAGIFVLFKYLASRLPMTSAYWSAIPTLCLAFFSLAIANSGWVTIIIVLCALSDYLIGRNFIAGMASFTVAYLSLLLYIISTLNFDSLNIGLLIIGFLFLAFNFSAIIPNISKQYALPLSGYMLLVLSPLLFTGLSLLHSNPYIAVACVSIVISDSFIGLNMIRSNKDTVYKVIDKVVMFTYWFGIALLAGV